MSEKGAAVGDIVLYAFANGSTMVQRPGIVIGVNNDATVNLRVFVDPDKDGPLVPSSLLLRGSCCFRNVPKNANAGGWSKP